MSEIDNKNDVELEKVSGGRILDKLPKRKRKCKKCGKEFETPFLVMGMSIVGPGSDEWRKHEKARAYYRDMCEDCAKKYPYQGE